MRHYNFAKQNGLKGVIERARGGKSFWMDPEAGPWATLIARDAAFAERFAAQDLERYLGIISTTGRGLFDRDTATGAEPEEVMGIKAPSLIIPGDDPSHATSGAHYLRELLPKARFLECDAARADDARGLRSHSWSFAGSVIKFRSNRIKVWTA